MAALAADVRSAKKRKLALRILGQGSNVVLRDFDGLTMTPALPGIAVSGNMQHAVVRVGAGVNWPSLVSWCCAHGLHGLENLAMIPGSAGAAPVQNIGAYGLEISERLQALDLFDIEQERLMHLPAAAAGFGYRASLFKHNGNRIICALYLNLGKAHAPVLHYPDVAEAAASAGGGHAGVYHAVCRLRAAKLPASTEVQNAGCFFQNPSLARSAFDALRLQLAHLVCFPEPHSDKVRVPAAQLVEACGWKGRLHGKVGVSARHALVLVNRGQAQARDVCALGDAIRQDVQNRFGVSLTREPVLM